MGASSQQQYTKPLVKVLDLSSILLSSLVILSFLQFGGHFGLLGRSWKPGVLLEWFLDT